MIKTQMFIGAALLTGVAVGYFAGGHGNAVRPAEREESPNVQKAVADTGDASSVKALRRRVAELEKLLAENNARSEIAISNAVAEAMRNRPPEPPRGNRREWMEELKKNDPARYAQMTNRFANWRRNRAEQAQSKIDFLSSIDTSHMSAGAKKTHAALQELIAKREETEAELQRLDLSDEERDALMRELRSTDGDLRRLNREERTNLLDETARALGFEGEDAREVTATIQEVIKATDAGWGGRPHGGPRGGGPGGR